MIFYFIFALIQIGEPTNSEAQERIVGLTEGAVIVDGRPFDFRHEGIHLASSTFKEEFKLHFKEKQTKQVYFLNVDFTSSPLDEILPKDGTQIESLLLVDCVLSEADVRYVGKLTHLKILNVMNSTMQDEWCDYFLTCHCLQHLYLTKAEAGTLAKLRKQLPALKKIHLVQQ